MKNKGRSSVDNVDCNNLCITWKSELNRENPNKPCTLVKFYYKFCVPYNNLLYSFIGKQTTNETRLIVLLNRFR